ncbi:Hypothetical_protein [Hexamita inflata]|uniref:Hypothetical_protein n=1 Tax=Hexamita inflata TaxID=28002 RepID=A0AA86Q5J6_9EUKA|nr:Hypothetical protein HINF_LOCUS40206 [Hexamita inflata]
MYMHSYFFCFSFSDYKIKQMYFFFFILILRSTELSIYRVFLVVRVQYPKLSPHPPIRVSAINYRVTSLSKSVFPAGLTNKQFQSRVQCSHKLQISSSGLNKTVAFAPKTINLKTEIEFKREQNGGSSNCCFTAQE